MEELIKILNNRKGKPVGLASKAANTADRVKKDYNKMTL